jgi:hypothetical protein
MSYTRTEAAAAAAAATADSNLACHIQSANQVLLYNI